MADKGMVLVTGGSGFIGAWCVVRLLEDGWRVRATVRDLKREPEMRAAIGALAPAAREAEGPLTFAAASLERDAGWAEAVAGCRYVLHVASPIPIAQPKDPDELVIPARDGALRVLRAAVAAGVERVVMTSSVAAVGEAGAEGVADERDWTDLSRTDVTPYARSKTVAERAAREFMHGQAGTTFATVNPALVLGPAMSRDYSPSLELPARLLRGAVPGLPRIGFNMVDVRDVADLHLLAMTRPEAAGGRYIAAGEFLWMEDVARMLREQLGPPASRVPTRRLPDWMVKTVALFDPAIRTIAGGLSRRREFSSARAERELGWRPRPVPETLVDTARSLEAVGAI